jgi:hypothetical protein
MVSPHLFGDHMKKLSLWSFECKEGTHNKNAAKSETNGKLLWHQRHDWKEHGKSKKYEKHASSDHDREISN